MSLKSDDKLHAEMEGATAEEKEEEKISNLPKAIQTNSSQPSSWKAQKSWQQIKTAMECLEEGTKSWNPHWITSGRKLEKIEQALNELSPNVNNANELENKDSKLYQAVNNMKRLNFLFFCCDTDNERTTTPDIVSPYHHNSM